MSAAGETTTHAFTFDDVSVVMGTYDEEAAVDTVLADIDAATGGKAAVVCVDGSTDRTPEIAEEFGARVIHQEPRGYGVAIRCALRATDRPVVVTTDCDDTYPMERLPDFLSAINDGADVVSGDRLSLAPNAMGRVERLGNRGLASLASLLAGVEVRDVSTGMRAFRREVIERIRWTENRGLSAELLLRPLARGYDVRERRIDYRDRDGPATRNRFVTGLGVVKSVVKVGIEERLR